MTEDRLSALCLINVYNKVEVLDQINHIIDIFDNSKNRPFEFVLRKLLFCFCYKVL